MRPGLGNCLCRRFLPGLLKVGWSVGLRYSGFNCTVSQEKIGKIQGKA
jgi:hypothetical protein